MADIILEEVAEDYCSGLDTESLKDIVNSNIDREELKNWLESEYPEEKFDVDNISDFIDYIVEQAKWQIDETKQNEASELRSSIEDAIRNQCYTLENYEIVSILADYVVRYLDTGL